jgi:hypothetical protein
MRRTWREEGSRLRGGAQGCSGSGGDFSEPRRASCCWDAGSQSRQRVPAARRKGARREVRAEAALRMRAEPEWEEGGKQQAERGRRAASRPAASGELRAASC